MRSPNRVTKSITAFFIFLLLLAAIYFITWAETRRRSVLFYRDAIEALEREDLDSAIKGSEITISGKYKFRGGLQTVNHAWDSAWAWPKPDVYRQSAALLEKVINEDMSAEDGMRIFNRFFQLDREYLDRILLRVGDIYLEREEYDKARDTYRTAIEIYINDESVQEYARKQLSRI